MTTARGEVDEARTVPHDDQARPADGGAASPRGALAADGVSVHRLLVSALSTVANAVAIADTDGAIVWSNRACAALTGLEPEEALGRHLPSIGDPAEGPGGDTAAWAEVLAGRPWRGERRFGTGHGGEPRTVHQTLTPILDPDATVRYVVAVCDDVTDLERTRAELARRVAQQTAIAELSQYALGASDPRDVISEAERTLTELLGEELDTSVRTLAAKSPDECGSVGEGLVCVRVGGRCVLKASPERDRRLSPEDREFLRAVAGVIDATVQRIGTREELAHLASHDGLTGLPNRPLFLDRLGQARAASRRDDGHYAVLIVDLDGFKVVNEALGPEMGDEALRLVAARLTGLVRPNDTVARFGGDEFAVLCHAIGEPAEARTVAARIHEALAAGFDLDGEHLPLTASLGVAVGDVGSEPSALLRQADTATHWAKDRGRNRTELFSSPMQDAALRRFDVTAALRHALETGGIAVAHQPVLELATGRIVGVEALARLVLPSGATVPPDQFIGVAEDTGLIGALGEQVLRRACAEAAPWIAARQGFVVSVNLSPHQLADGAIIRTVERALGEAGLPAGALCLELTESAMLSGLGAGEAIRALRGLGVALAIDDFGTGYSSLAHLRHMPVDGLKIDRSFVGSIHASAQDHALVAAAIDLARAFGLHTTAEGVETAAHRDELAALGCRYAQGYLWSPPVDAATLTAMLAG